MLLPSSDEQLVLGDDTQAEVVSRLRQMATCHCCGRSMKMGQQKKAKTDARHNAAIVKNSLGVGMSAGLTMMVMVAVFWGGRR